MNKKKIKSKISKGLKETKKEIKRLLNLIKKTPSDKRNKARREKVKTLKKIEKTYIRAKTAKNPLKLLAKVQDYKKQLRKPKEPKKIPVPPFDPEEISIKDQFKDLIAGKDPLNTGLREAFMINGVDVNDPAQLEEIKTLLSGYSWNDLINYIENLENDYIYEIFYELNVRAQRLGSRNIDEGRIKNMLSSIIEDMAKLRMDNFDPAKIRQRNKDDTRTDEEITDYYKALYEDINRAREKTLEKWKEQGR